MDPRLEKLLELALESPRRALFEAWYWATGGALDSPRFQALVQYAIAGDHHKSSVDAILGALRNGANEDASLEKLASGLTPSPLAWLMALDRYAHDQVPAQGEPQWEISPQLALSDAPKNGVGKFVIRRRQWPLGVDESHARQPGHIQHWMRSHWISPSTVGGRTIRVVAMPPTIMPKGQAVAASGTLRVAVVSLRDGAKLRWQAEGNARLAVGVDDEAARRAALRAGLAAACEASADVLVAPELTVTEALRHDLIEFLLETPNHPLWMVTPGSFHELKPQPSDGLAHSNTARLLDPDGRELARHHKLRPFSWEEGGNQCVEAIAPGQELVLLETPIGHIAMAICLDQCEESAPLQELWEWAAPDLLLTPAMDSAEQLEPYGRAADRAARSHGCCSVIANQPPEPDNGQALRRSLVRAREKRLDPAGSIDVSGCNVDIYVAVIGPGLGG